jgi:ribosomal protein S19
VHEVQRTDLVRRNTIRAPEVVGLNFSFHDLFVYLLINSVVPSMMGASLPSFVRNRIVAFV